LDAGIQEYCQYCSENQQSFAAGVETGSHLVVERENQQKGERIQTEIHAAEGILNKSEKKGTGRPEAKPGTESEVHDKNEKHIRFEGIRQVCGKDIHLEDNPDNDQDKNIEIFEHNVRCQTRSKKCLCWFHRAAGNATTRM